MKKFIIVIVIIIAAVLILFPNNETNDVRIRVVANSDGIQDQNIKYDIVNILKKHIKNEDDVQNIDNARFEISEYFASKKISYQYKIEYKNVNFPPKELNGKLIPGGTYMTLLVTLGTGKGENYWSLLYPRYFDISFEDVQSDNVEVKFYFFEKIKSIFKD